MIDPATISIRSASTAPAGALSPARSGFGAASTASIANSGSVDGAGNTSLPSRARRRHADRWFGLMS